MKKVVSICKYCGAEFEYSGLGRRKSYCSSKCRQLNKNKTSEKCRRKKQYLKKYGKAHDRMNAIAKIQRDTGVSYGLLSPVWEDKEALAKCIARYRRR